VRVYCACNECHDALFGPFRLYEVDTQAKAYETIVKVIKTRQRKKDKKMEEQQWLITTKLQESLTRMDIT
jgi:hypothetical protein